MSQKDIDDSNKALKNNGGMSGKVGAAVADIAVLAPVTEHWYGNDGFSSAIRAQLDSEIAEVKTNLSHGDPSSNSRNLNTEALADAIVATAGKSDPEALSRLTREVSDLLVGRELKIYPQGKGTTSLTTGYGVPVYKTYTEEDVKYLVAQISQGQKDIEASHVNDKVWPPTDDKLLRWVFT
jgi:hypothetical protein